MRRNTTKQGGGPYEALLSGSGMRPFVQTFPSMKQARVWAVSYGREADELELYDRNGFIVLHLRRASQTQSWFPENIGEHPHRRPIEN